MGSIIGQSCEVKVNELKKKLSIVKRNPSFHEVFFHKNSINFKLDTTTAFKTS